MNRDDEDAVVRAECTRRGLKFKPWECAPWSVGDGPVPAYATGSPWGASWVPAQRLRRRLLAEAKQTNKTEGSES